MNEMLNSPVRRSIANTTIRTPGRYHPNESIASVSASMQDDEAERVSRRSTMSGTDLEMNLTEENAQVSSCLRMFNENKLTKENAWNVHLIDHFSNLVAKHHKSMANFQVAGSTLEASAKVYVLRVDSLHQDTMRMVSNLSRQTARQLGADRDGENDDDNDDMDRSNEENNANVGNTQQKKKEKRKRRAAAVVTKNPDSLNGKLDTNPFTDPFFAKLNSIVGDINSSSRLMQNIIPTKSGSLQLRMDTPSWDRSEAQPITYDENENYENQVIVRIKTLDANENHALHHQLKGYSISDKPAEDEPDEEMPQGLLNHSTCFHERPMNVSGSGVVFDPNAEVEPIANDNNFVIDFGAAADDDNDFEQQLETEDHDAIMRCRGLRREAVVIEDMKPIDAHSSMLEYSYRPLDRFSEFWAGPSHWKIRRQPSMAKRSFTAANQSGGGQMVANKRKPRKKKVQKNATAAEMLNEVFSQTFVERENLLKRITYTRAHISKKWNVKKLKLPTHMKIEANVFDKCFFGTQLRPMNQTPEVEPEIEVQNYDYNNENDNEYCRDVNAETDADTETDFGTADDNPHNTSDERMMSPTEFQSPVNQTVDFIATDFAGAPEKVEKILISYAKRAKPVDMKQLKAQCWNLISELPKTQLHTPLETSKGELLAQIEFKEVYDKLPRVLTKSMAENISTGLVFYSVLHLANEKGVYVMQNKDLEGCRILKKDL